MGNTALKMDNTVYNDMKLKRSSNLKKLQEESPITARFDLSRLTEKEETYFRMMFSQKGVLYLMSEPGLAKSSIARAIAKKLDMNYIDIRLSMIDETDLGLYPDKTPRIIQVEGEDKTVNFLTHIVPEWAYNSNQKPTIIHFEELNRAPLSVRNAALQILLERCIGHEFKFNDNVFMIASGNLGDEDGTDVEELDSALMGRLLPYRHFMDLGEWKEAWANDNITYVVLSFLSAHKEYYYVQRKSTDDPSKVCPTPRNWTFLSEMIEANFGKDPDPTKIASFVSRIGNSYIGNCTQPFVQYCKDIHKVTIQDVIERYSNFHKEGITLDEPKRNELMNRLKKEKLGEVSERGVENVKKFLLDCRDDSLASFLIKIMDTDIDTSDIENMLDMGNNAMFFAFLADPRFKSITKIIYTKLNTFQ